MDEKLAHRSLADTYIQLLSTSLKQDIFDLRKPGALVTDVNSEHMRKSFPPRLQYACLQWVGHLRMSGAQVSDNDQFHDFLRKHLLHWLESLSWMQKVSTGILAISSLESIALSNDCPRFYAFLRDAKKFVLSNRSCIEQAPLQIYYSAITFAPTESIIRKQFEDEIPRLIKRLPIVQEREILQPARGHLKRVTAIAFSPDSARLVSASADSTAILWNKATGEALCTLGGHSATINAVAFSPDGMMLASASSDLTIRLWDASTGSALRTLKGHLGEVNAVAFSPDGKQLVTASIDSTIMLWDAIAGVLLCTLEVDTFVQTVSFSGDRQKSITDKEVASIFVKEQWIARGPENLLWLPSDHRATTVAISANTVILGHESGRISIFELVDVQNDPEEGPEEDLQGFGDGIERDSEEDPNEDPDGDSEKDLEDDLEEDFEEDFEEDHERDNEKDNEKDLEASLDLQRRISTDNDFMMPSIAWRELRHDTQESFKQQGITTPPSSRTKYEYERLDRFRAVRFIELQPKRDISSCDIHINLFEASLEDALPYSALSYAWGTSNKSEYVTCNGQLLAVTPNLLAALSAVRKKFCSQESLVLWVDAICINQSNDEEKTEQLQRIRSIYRGAERVIAWFGEETNNGDAAIGLLAKFHKLYEMSQDNPGRNVRGAVQVVNLPSPNSSDWEALNEFIDRPFSERIWIVQEIVSAYSCTILSGETTLDWEWFCCALRGCQLYQADIHPHVKIKGVDGILKTQGLKTRIRGRSGRDFLDVLTSTMRLRSTDPRDKIYAVSSLSDSNCAASIIPDYTISVTELFQQVARSLIDTSNSLDVLNAVSPLTRITDNNLPSWTPDWTVISGEFGLLSDRYNAARNTYPIVREHEKSHILSLSGCEVDEVKRLGEKMARFLIDEMTVDDLFRVCTSFFNEGIEESDPTDHIEAQAITLVGGRGPHGEFPMDDSHCRQRVREWLAWFHTMHSDQLTKEVGEHRIAAAKRIDTSNYRGWFDAALAISRPMVTSKGRYGLAPLLAEEGDIVCILLGGQMPFILRPEDDEEWQLVGPAYVHGLMNGEALENDQVRNKEALESDFLNLRDFNIR